MNTIYALCADLLFLVWLPFRAFKGVERCLTGIFLTVLMLVFNEESLDIIVKLADEKTAPVIQRDREASLRNLRENVAELEALVAEARRTNHAGLKEMEEGLELVRLELATLEARENDVFLRHALKEYKRKFK